MSNYDSNSNRKRMHYSPNLLACLNNAIDNHVLIDLEYDSNGSDLTKRQVEPMALVYKNRKRNLVAFCHLRNDWRTFRLDRIELVKLGTKTFEKRSDFNLDDFESDNKEDEDSIIE